MCAVFPRSDYYGGSVPRPRRRRTYRLAGIRVSGARIEVPMFAGETLGAVGGWLCPWQRGPTAESGYGDGVPISSTLRRSETSDRELAACSRDASLAPYRGIHHHLQRAGLSRLVSPWHLW
jgi:hypothetical protein